VARTKTGPRPEVRAAARANAIRTTSNGSLAFVRLAVFERLIAAITEQSGSRPPFTEIGRYAGMDQSVAWRMVNKGVPASPTFQRGLSLFFANRLGIDASLVRELLFSDGKEL
jgi:hypothetical protein